jgi:type II secretory pathway pseudopilin PulG
MTTKQNFIRKTEQKSLAGFTFLEMMFTVVIFSAMFMVMFQFMNVANDNWRDAEVRTQFREQIERTLDQIFGELRIAGRTQTVILTDLRPGTTQNGFFIPTNALSRADGKTYGLGFRLPKSGVGGSVTVLTGDQINYGNKVLYYQNTDNQLIRAEVDDTQILTPPTAPLPTVLIRNVSFFEVMGDGNVGPSYVDVRFNIQKDSLSKRLVFYGDDPAGGSAWRGASTRIVPRNIQAIDPVASGSNQADRTAAGDSPSAM